MQFIGVREKQFALLFNATSFIAVLKSLFQRTARLGVLLFVTLS